MPQIKFNQTKERFCSNPPRMQSRFLILSAEVSPCAFPKNSGTATSILVSLIYKKKH